MILEWVEIIARWILGLQMLFWGLNSFFNWKQIPPSAAPIENFVKACIETRFLMPTVKLVEILGGALLLTGYGTLLAEVVLAPLIFVICGLHLRHNPRGWTVVLPLALPYLVILLLNAPAWRVLFL